MFDARAFASWPLMLAGAAVFALLFTIASVLIELLLEGRLRFTDEAMGFGAAAFGSYLLMALLVRRSAATEGDDKFSGP